MGAVAAEATDFWARVQTAENQKLPDSKARVRFLLDEIALLQTRFDNKNKKQQQDHHELDNFRDLFSDVSQQQQEQETGEARHEHVESALEALNEPLVDELRADDDVTRSMGFAHRTRCEDFLQFIEEKLRSLVEERVGFFETAERELRIGKVERLELAKLLRSEKTGLQRHRQELEDFRAKWTCWEDENTFWWNAVQEIIERFLKLLDDREGLQLKFEVQVELGHFFRLLKLLEVQKAKDENSKREVEKKIHEFRTLLDKTCTEEEDSKREVKPTVEETFQREVEPVPTIDEDQVLDENMSEIESGTKEAVVDTDDETCTVPVPLEDGDGLAVDDFRQSKREAKMEILKLMAEQEQKWKGQQEVLWEMNRRLSISELESQRLTAALKDERHCECNKEAEVTSMSGGLPQGFTSMYFSPIYQERRQTLKADDKDVQIEKLKKEVSNLKETLMNREKQVFFNGVQIPLEEKTIPIDASSKRYEIDNSSSCELLDSACSERTVDYCHISDEDRTFCEKAVQNVSLMIQRHRQELASVSSGKVQAEVRETFVEAFRTMSVQCRQLCEEIEVHFNKEVSSHQLKADMVRVADEHARELDRKEKTLAYAQELNLRLANDMSKAENALSDLRVEHTGLRLSLESKLKTAQNEADALARKLEIEITNLDQQLKEKERHIQDVTSRAEACQRETDAAVLEKNSCLQRLQRVTDELEERNVRVQSLENELTRCKQDVDEDKETSSSQLQEAREELSRVSDAHHALERRYQQLQTRLLEIEYELAQRESALERLTLHLAASAAQQNNMFSVEEVSTESLRSRYRRKEQARKSIHEAEEQMAVIAAEMSKAKSEMEEMKSQGFQLLHRLRMR